VPLLVKNRHEVVALVRSSQKVREVEAMRAKATLADALNKEELTAAIRKAEWKVSVRAWAQSNPWW